MSRKKQAVRYPFTSKQAELFFGMLHNESDAGCLLVACNVFDILLEGAIRRKLKAMSGISTTLLDELLTGKFAPISHFAMRLRFARALGLTDSNLDSALNTIRDLRNSVAHPKTPFTFATDRVDMQKLIWGLSCNDQKTILIYDWLKKQTCPGRQHQRRMFELIAMSLWYMLSDIASDPLRASQILDGIGFLEVLKRHVDDHSKSGARDS